MLKPTHPLLRSKHNNILLKPNKLQCFPKLYFSDVVPVGGGSAPLAVIYKKIEISKYFQLLFKHIRCVIYYNIYKTEKITHLRFLRTYSLQYQLYYNIGAQKHQLFP